jgi:hypothetical protein
MEIAFEPYKKVSFRSYLRYETAEELARAVSLSAPVGLPAQYTLRWSNGVLFHIVGFQPTDSVVKEYIAGHVVWDHIDFALMPRYVKEIRLPEKPLVVFSVLDLSEHPVFGPLGEWIRENLVKSETVAERRVLG